MNYEKYLPIGTVVLLKDAKKRMMITGFLCTGEKEDKIYDYAACLYPEGVLDAKKTLLFNHEQIEKIYHLGLIDDEEKEFIQKLKDVKNIVNTANQTNNSNTNTEVNENY